ncbi:hypothetical protein NP233_g558 [Leucocoprinus birnbaumii]|uniref:Cytochrome P450 n=1 Tax=Leucocoprinus birnbaumii TaxID=56174 RepID=A0AAD5YWL3_9AGAR|nr:hypothetical protein NP233_g558 [Leucocoprinus birnbaumii]
MDSVGLQGVLVLILLALSFGALSRRAAFFFKPLPPGPTILTRILENRSEEPLYFKFKRWSQQYGAVISLMDFVHFGKPTIILSTPKAAMDLLERRGNIYSSRPRNVFAAEVAFKSARGSLMPMGTTMRRFRTVMNATMSAVASKRFRSLEDSESKLMLRDLLQEKDPMRYRTHVQRSVHSIAFCTAFGQRIEHLALDHLHFYESLEKFFARFSIPGRSLVDHFPLLARLPLLSRWLCREAVRQGSVEEQFFRLCVNQAKSIHTKPNDPLLAASAHTLERRERFGLTDSEVAFLAATPYTAEVTTTLGTCDIFLQAILLYPDVMYKAQREIDTVVGPDRMPDFQDFDTLPYIRAMIKETLRWHPFVPLGIPHAATEDDIYEGMFIPAGSTVIANIYAITHDTELFPDPEQFKPERFLDVTDPLLKNYNMTFGFGRRICPGQYVATDQLFIMISRLLWAFDVRPLKEATSEIEGTNAFWGRTKLMPYNLIPRSDRVSSLIGEGATIAQEAVKSWESLDYSNMSDCFGRTK